MREKLFPCAARAHGIRRVFNQGGCILGCFGGFAGKAADLPGHDSEAFSGFSGPGCFHGCIQCQYS